MSDRQEEQDVYKKYSIRSEHALCVTASTSRCGKCKNSYVCECKSNRCYYEIRKSSLWNEDKLWEFVHDSSCPGRLQLLLKKDSSAGNDKTAAEVILWHWNGQKEIVILHQKVHDNFSNLYENTATASQLHSSKKFNVVIRLLDKRNENGNNSLLESYYGDFGKAGIEMVTLHIVGTNGQTEASFTIPKLDLMQASAVFHRMFTAEMTEKVTGEVKIKDTTAEEFGDFLKAISPKQEYPNPSNVHALLILADRFDCPLLRERCEAHLMNCIEIPLVDRINCASFYGLKKLKKNLLMHLKGTRVLGFYKIHRDLMQALTNMGV